MKSSSSAALWYLYVFLCSLSVFLWFSMFYQLFSMFFSVNETCKRKCARSVRAHHFCICIRLVSANKSCQKVVKTDFQFQNPCAAVLIGDRQMLPWQTNKILTILWISLKVPDFFLNPCICAPFIHWMLGAIFVSSQIFSFLFMLSRATLVKTLVKEGYLPMKY